VALFGVSMGVLLGAYAFTTEGIGERLLGTIGHANLQAFARTWGRLWLPELAASGIGKILEVVISRTKKREFLPLINLLQVANNLKKPDKYGFACNPMNYIDKVAPHRRVRFLVGANDPIVSVKDARNCAAQFPDGACYVVPGLAHGVNKSGSSFVDHVRYFLATQLGDWQ
jgi:pimeloyl-ACP methyl ester carboxylesterase